MNSAGAFAAYSNHALAAFSSAPAADLAIDAETLMWQAILERVESQPKTYTPPIMKKNVATVGANRDSAPVADIGLHLNGWSIRRRPFLTFPIRESSLRCPESFGASSKET